MSEREYKQLAVSAGKRVDSAIITIGAPRGPRHYVDQKSAAKYAACDVKVSPNGTGQLGFTVAPTLLRQLAAALIQAADKYGCADAPNVTVLLLDAAPSSGAVSPNGATAEW